ncbi:hypothetical protein J2S49_000259 [Arcanobacterium wilhelmae]|uniref:DUF3043 domain-containing protein n=1 Tax=Arcanobacterium wilhelmae TaxID=1803177 RepID=A0ABT9N904_9ACTO|nr:DUF3043 domain-containing protein [Arcanobacterium wilhelmae]MDP9800183.1 hypothetical protein [Arcanobacterium wilhelmae]WFN89624.1 DUF3043 domain-containing protein [Arcanobacterium wilhelmae]
MFGKKQNEPAEEVHTPQATLPKGYTPSKGAPTPRRKDQVRRRQRPLVQDRTSLTKEERKARRAEDRARADEAYHREQEAMRTGDERHMPARFQGAWRRFGRDYIDASGPWGAFFIPLAFLLLPTIFFQAQFPRVGTLTTIGIYLILIVMGIQGAIVARRAQILAGHRYGFEHVKRGYFSQMFGRTFYLRRWRMPAAQVARGEFPKGSSKEDLAAAKAAYKEWKKN